MPIKNQPKQLGRQIITSILLGILMCAFTLPKQVYATDTTSTHTDINAFIEDNQAEKSSSINELFLFTLTKLPFVSRSEYNFRKIITREILNQRPIFARQSRKASLSARILPDSKSLVDRKQGHPVFNMCNLGDVKRLILTSQHIFQPLDQQNSENNNYRGPPT